MKLYECIMDDGETAFKTTLTAKNKKRLREIYKSNGDFVHIEDITPKLTEEILEKLSYDLARTGWNKDERALICAVVKEEIK